MDVKDKLMVALDVPTFDEARQLVDDLGDAVNVFKVGSQLFTACGPVVVRYLLAQGKKVFLDLKFHDIPNTVANAVSAAVGLGEPGHDVMGTSGIEMAKGQKGLFMCTLHTQGGEEMLCRAVDAAKEKAGVLGIKPPLLVGITVLTSQTKTDNIYQLVMERSQLARKAGLDGVVASSQEAAMIREEMGPDFVIVTPGIRPVGVEVGDQKRVTTPAEALINGSDYLVVGRPIVQASSPQEAAQAIVNQMKSACKA